MAGFGEELKAERESRGLSIERLSGSTKVNARHFEALEVGNYGALPGGVFRRGIVRAYVTALGLDEQEWMARFQASLDAQTGMPGRQMQDEAWATFARNVKRNRGASRRPSTVKWFGVFALLALVGGTGWAVWNFVLRARLR